MPNPTCVGVTSRSFSKHEVLKSALRQKYESVKFNEEGKSLAGDELVEFLSECEYAIVALEKIDQSILTRLPQLKVISKYGVGLDGIDLKALEKQGIRLGWTAGVNSRSVAELALCFMIDLLRNVSYSVEQVHKKIWKQVKGSLLTGKTVGIIGCGHVGKNLVSLLQAFNCRMLVNDIVDYPDFYHNNCLVPVSIEELLSQSDVVSLHVPLDSSTKMLLNKQRLSLMKKEAILINTARGGLVDESFLSYMLENKMIAGAAFDVLEIEPPIDYSLIEQENFRCTPHIGGSSHEAILAMGQAAITGLETAKLLNKDALS